MTGRVRSGEKRALSVSLADGAFNFLSYWQDISLPGYSNKKGTFVGDTRVAPTLISRLS